MAAASSFSFGPRPPLDTCFRTSQSTTIINSTIAKSSYLHPRPKNKPQQIIGFRRKQHQLLVNCSRNILDQYYSCSKALSPLQKSWIQITAAVPFATSIAVLLCSTPANAGLLSGSSGIESIPGPELPQMDFLTRFNEENQKRYAENDARFKESPLLKQLLERSKLNKEKNRQAIQDKYCIRGAEWGVGDCSAEGMTLQEREEFIAMLKKKAGVE